MDYKKLNAPLSTITRDVDELSKETGNIYESVMIMAHRANQISQEMKTDLEQKLQEFTTYSENLEEVCENTEQTEISKFYERLPKPVLIAAKEFESGETYWRNPLKEDRFADDDDDVSLPDATR